MSELLIDRAGRVLTLTLNRPQVGNAMTPDLMNAVGDAIVDARGDDIAAIVLTGAGDRHFCTGIDIKAFAQAEQAGAGWLEALYSGARRSLFEIVAESDVPVIAAVNGAAISGGFELMLACDFAVAADHATFGCPEAKRGVGAQFAAVVLPRRIAPALALDMLLTGTSIDAAEAYRRGLLVEVCADAATARDVAGDRARRIAANAPLTVRRIRRTARRSREMPLVAALRLDEHPNPYLSEDRIEGLRAFTERREPVWKGK